MTTTRARTSAPRDRFMLMGVGGTLMSAAYWLHDELAERAGDGWSLWGVRGLVGVAITLVFLAVGNQWWPKAVHK